jgi:hypothetical protein
MSNWALRVEPMHRPGRTDGLDELQADILPPLMSRATLRAGWVRFA